MRIVLAVYEPRLGQRPLMNSREDNDLSSGKRKLHWNAVLEIFTQKVKQKNG